HVDAQVRLDPVPQQRSGARAAELVGDHGRHQDVALEAGPRTNDGLERADGGDAAALVVVGAHAPNPTVLELGAVRIDAPAAHLDARVHMAVDEERRAAAASFEAADGLPGLR